MVTLLVSLAGSVIAFGLALWWGTRHVIPGRMTGGVHADTFGVSRRWTTRAVVARHSTGRRRGHGSP